MAVRKVAARSGGAEVHWLPVVTVSVWRIIDSKMSPLTLHATDDPQHDGCFAADLSVYGGGLSPWH